MTSTAQEARASRNGARRTIFYTKKLPDGKEGEDKKYARTHQYLGEWKDNKWHGKGTLEKADGSRYVGEWKAGKRDGVGTLWHRHADGSLRKVYSGLWVDDMQQGRGTLNYKSGDVYIGDWVRGQRAGSGICTYADGGVYEGEWLDDKRHGFGVYDYKNGDHFEGHWMADLTEGKGVHFYYDKEKKAHTKRYDGEWVDDTPRCGAYTEMPPDPLAPLSMLPDPLPPNELVDANGVLSKRLSEVRAERAQLRAKRIALEERFTEEELEALQLAFRRVDVEDAGVITYKQLPSAFEHVGMAPTSEELAAVLSQLGKAAEPATELHFEHFAQAADMLSPVEE